MKTKLTLVITAILLIATLGGCTNHLNVEQDLIKTNGDYTITTYIWQKDFLGIAKELHYIEFVNCNADVDNLMSIERKKAEVEKIKLEKILRM